MNDPHVEALHYRLVPADGIEFRNPEPIDHETDKWKLELADGRLTIWPKRHFATTEDAQAAVDPLLRSWQISDALLRGSVDWRFDFVRGELIDREPDPPGVVNLAGRVELHIGASAALTLGRPSYPAPPQDFALSWEVEMMWHHYQRYLQDRDLLLPMAYLCLSVAEYAAGNRKQTATALGISQRVLNILGELASELGDERTARKLSRRSKRRAPTSEEREWIHSVVKILIQRMGACAIDSAQTFSQITMSDLPSLPRTEID